METERGEIKNEDLVRRAQAGDSRAFDRLIQRHFGTVYTVAYGRLGQRQASEDLAQEVFLRAYLFLKETDWTPQFAVRLTRMAHGLADDWTRRGQRTSSLVSSVPIDEIPAGSAEDREVDTSGEALEHRQNRILQMALFRLPVAPREFVLLYCVEGLSREVIAERLGVPLATVSDQLQKGLVALKGMLEPIVRESAQGLKSSREAVSRTVALVRSVSALPAPSRATLCQWAAETTLPTPPPTPRPLGSVTVGRPGLARAVVGALSSVFTS